MRQSDIKKIEAAADDTIRAGIAARSTPRGACKKLSTKEN
jgi:hypothetical protein